MKSEEGISPRIKLVALQVKLGRLPSEGQGKELLEKYADFPSHKKTTKIQEVFPSSKVKSNLTTWIPSKPAFPLLDFSS
jgi:hypothetical protein